MTEANEETAMPALFEHCTNVYNKMMETATPVQAATPDQGYGVQAMMYEGHLTHLFAELRLSTPYYTSVVNRLKRMGCIQQERRGGGTAPSRWVLLQPPTPELFELQERKRPSQGRVAALEQQLRDLHKRLNDIERKVEALTP